MVSIRRTGFKANDAHTEYLEMGMPKTLSADQLKRLQRRTTDIPETSTVRVAPNGKASVKVQMRVNDVVLIQITPK